MPRKLSILWMNTPGVVDSATLMGGLVINCWGLRGGEKCILSLVYRGTVLARSEGYKSPAAAKRAARGFIRSNLKEFVKNLSNDLSTIEEIIKGI